MELWNEFNILLLYGQILTQADFVDDPQSRIAAGWALIGLITLCVVTNFGYVLYSEGCEAVRWYQRMTTQTSTPPLDTGG